jgi:hypothetical protein
MLDATALILGIVSIIEIAAAGGIFFGVGY